MRKSAACRSEWTLAWTNPYTQPPNGKPRVLATEIVEGGSHNKPATFDGLSVPGDGYGWHWRSLDEMPTRRLSDETKRKIRRGNLKRRVMSKAPLFASALIADAIAHSPEYFGGTA